MLTKLTLPINCKDLDDLLTEDAPNEEHLRQIIAHTIPYFSSLSYARLGKHEAGFNQSAVIMLNELKRIEAETGVSLGITLPDVCKSAEFRDAYKAMKNVPGMKRGTREGLRAIHRRLIEELRPSICSYQIEQGNVYDFNNGVQAIIDAVDRIQETPILIAVYGAINNGKSYLISRLEEHYRARGRPAIGYGGAPCDHTFDFIKSHPEIDLYIFHCAWFRHYNKMFVEVTSHEEPNSLAPKMLGRDIDFNIAVINPNMLRTPLGDSRREAYLYDFILLNPDSVVK